MKELAQQKGAKRTAKKRGNLEGVQCIQPPDILVEDEQGEQKHLCRDHDLVLPTGIWPGKRRGSLSINASAYSEWTQ